MTGNSLTIYFESHSPGKPVSKEISLLLTESQLPVSDLSQSKIHFIVALAESNLIGCIGVEQHGKHGLLRSFAVRPQHRNAGVGGQLFQKMLAYCQQLGMENIHLLTTTAEKYFSLKGFLKASRDEAPLEIKNTTEFSAICPSSSSYMTFKLTWS